MLSVWEIRCVRKASAHARRAQKKNDCRSNEASDLDKTQDRHDLVYEPGIAADSTYSVEPSITPLVVRETKRNRSKY
jgi:hypothetical protein